MSLQVETIKTAYETLHLTPEQIAETQGLEITSVKAALMSVSKQYRNDIGCVSQDTPTDESSLDFTDEDLRDMNEILRDTAKHATLADGSPDWRVRSDIAKYIRDDKKGRKNPVKQMGNQFNIFTFNESIKQMREMKNKMITDIGGIASAAS